MIPKKRSYLCHYLEVLDCHNNTQLGVLADLSNEGLMFISDKIIPPNEIKDICIKDNLCEQDVFFIHASIQILWNKPNLNPQMHCMGCKILAIDANDYIKLETIVKSLSFEENITVNRTFQ